MGRIGGKPIEAIRLASLCLETARKISHGSVTDQDVQAAWKAFSVERLEDIGSELGYAYPGSTHFLKCFQGFHNEFPLGKVKDAVDLGIIRSRDSPNCSSTRIRGYEDNYLGLATVLLGNQILLFKKSRMNPA